MLLHSSRRSVAEAWGGVARLPCATAAMMPGYVDDAPVDFDQTAWEQVLHAACGAGAALVAHSYGGPAAMSAAASRPDLVRALILFEPAAYALARGDEAVEAHIARLDPVFDTAARDDAATFWRRFMTAMTGSPPPELTPEQRIDAERQRRLPPPWTLRTPATLGSTPVLVITGGWNDEYEAIAARIPGAEHVVLPGHAHRPQDHPDAAGLVAEFLARRWVSPEESRSPG